MDALEQVKYVLAQLPREDQAEIHRFLDGMLLTDAEKEALLEARGGAVATVTGRGRRPRRADKSGRERASPGGAVTYRVERVKCGKAACTKCPHGPYTYKYWREDGRLRKAYVGKAARTREASRPRTPPDGA